MVGKCSLGCGRLKLGLYFQNFSTFLFWPKHGILWADMVLGVLYLELQEARIPVLSWWNFKAVFNNRNYRGLQTEQSVCSSDYHEPKGLSEAALFVTLHHTYGPLAWDSLNSKQLSLSNHNTLNKLQGRETEWSISKVGKKIVVGKHKNKLGCQEDARSPLVFHCAVTIHDVQRGNTKA